MISYTYILTYTIYKLFDALVVIIENVNLLAHNIQMICLSVTVWREILKMTVLRKSIGLIEISMAANLS